MSIRYSMCPCCHDENDERSPCLKNTSFCHNIKFQASLTLYLYIPTNQPTFLARFPSLYRVIVPRFTHLVRCCCRCLRPLRCTTSALSLRRLRVKYAQISVSILTWETWLVHCLVGHPSPVRWLQCTACPADWISTYPNLVNHASDTTLWDGLYTWNIVSGNKNKKLKLFVSFSAIVS